MSLDLRILHLEDSRDDAELVATLLETEGIGCEIERVQTGEDFVAALEKGGFDLILSDFSLPGFDGNSAAHRAEMLRDQKLRSKKASSVCDAHDRTDFETEP